MGLWVCGLVGWWVCGLADLRVGGFVGWWVGGMALIIADSGVMIQSQEVAAQW